MIPKIEDSVSFGYKHPLKTAYLKGLMPEVQYGIYGEKLTKETVSIEHIIPHSKGGKTDLGNIFLADKIKNSQRGVRPILEVINKEMIIKYLKQFINVKNSLVNGLDYIKIICSKFKIDKKEILK